MAPVSSKISGLEVSSLELDPRSEPFDLPTYLSHLSLDQRAALTSKSDFASSLDKRSEDLTPTLNHPITHVLSARDAASTTHPTNPEAGSVDPNQINMKAVQAAFAIIGASFVLLTIWFFFWAKNGGFQWKKNDWEEYKSTVLRRKGPNGTTLSNATKSTKLGGGSVVGQGYSDDGSSWTAGTETITDMSSEAPAMKDKKSKSSKKAKAKEAKIRQVHNEKWEGGHDDDVRAYRHEKPARVGGINRDSEAQFYGTDYTETNGSETRSNPRQARRDFSYGTEDTFSAAPAQESQAPRVPRHASPNKGRSRQSVPGSYVEPLDFSDTQSQNTKSYHHPIPGLSKNANGGFRRNRDDPLGD
ncbi:uncharacterized protein HMPREF1541_05638 [Cyphellophora europaea CBS 101466]|uniref:Uncharacterized protein n=1 Tax=Cyphellophora europaea (strain CBS 101466) TaxID=1220924 RepID=W2RSZ3_CYPE1|nr:uncharacterized protein HMPREF1541_05638 [Cyphellophora europaea CBS 101466]ETN39415.1 hypothetical protein HMPREF1541_05638 [Cyphellophora europaea CBS 101466]